MKYIRQSLIALVLLTLITGVIYPLAIYGFSQLMFPASANGSLLSHNGQIIGSRLIGQPFTSQQYFWSRPSATSDFPYNPLASGGSNLGPLNPALESQVAQRVQVLQATNPGVKVPVDLVTASASGLDPEISLAAAMFQIPRVAQARHLSLSQVQQQVAAHSQTPWLGLFGEARVNVLELNLALDQLTRN
jgi:K+-transporting ATPase ATPase C chain